MENNMKVEFSESMLKEIGEVVEALKNSGETRAKLPSNPEFEISLEDNDGDKITVAGENVFIKAKNIFGSTPLTERSML
jgi:hypothetical protein